MAVIPYEVSCGVLIHVFCQKMQDNEGWDSEYVSKEAQQKFLIGFLKILKKTDSTWHQFVEAIKLFCWDDLHASFVKEIELLENEDDLLDAFKSLEDLVIDQSSSIKLSAQNTPIKRTSVLGLFLRKLVLKFKKLTFEKINTLFVDYVKYKQLSNPEFEETKQSFDDSERSMDLSCMDENTASDVSVLESENKENQPSPVKISPKKTECQKTENQKTENQKTENNLTSREGVYQFIEENVLMLENNSHSVMPPNQLQEKLNEIQRYHSHIPDLYYLSFLNYLRVSEFNKASKMLCLYFDQKNFQNQATGVDSTELQNHQSMFKRFRYGALNFGIMHCQHKNYVQAMTVLKEAVSIAQETNDELCLKHAIFWIQIVKEETDKLDDKDIEGRCCELIKEIYAEDENVIDNVPEIECLDMLRCSKLIALRGLRNPGFVLSNISRIIVSNSKTSDSALLTRSSVLDFYGMKLLSAFNSQFLLQRTGGGKRRSNSNRQLSEENFTIAVCHLAMHFGSMYLHNEASTILEFLHTRHQCYSQYLPLVKETRLRLDFYKHISERNLMKAKHVADFFTVFNKDESVYMHAVIHTVNGNHTKAYQRAMSLNQELLSHEKSKTVPHLSIQIRLLLIELKLLSQDSTSCIEDILDLVTMLKRLKTNSFLIEVQCCSVRYNMKFGLFDKALKLINDVFITGFSNGNPYQLGCLYFLQAKCLTLKMDSAESEIKIETYKAVLSLYDQSFTFYEKAGAKARLRDVYYERSLVYYKMRLTQERNTAATQFRMLNEELNGCWNETFLF